MTTNEITTIDPSPLGAHLAVLVSMLGALFFTIGAWQLWAHRYGVGPSNRPEESILAIVVGLLMSGAILLP